jgi:hypothetical protein
MGYISASEAAEKWGRFPPAGAAASGRPEDPPRPKYGRAWMIPADVEKPGDLRKEKKHPLEALSCELVRLFEATSMPMPANNPAEILSMVT